MHKEILVIDDNPDIRLLVSNILKDQKYDVRTAANYDQAIFEINKKLPDLAIIDIKLDKPDKDGIDLLKLIKSVEKKLGRIKTKRNDPRVIDIDIIDFKSEINQSKELTLPHPKCHLRNFVLFPILQIDPNWLHPILKKNAQYLINNLSQKSRIEITRLKKNVNIET